MHKAMMMAASAAAPIPAPIPACAAVERPGEAGDVCDVAAGWDVLDLVGDEEAAVDVEAVGDGDAEDSEEGPDVDNGETAEVVWPLSVADAIVSALVSALAVVLTTLLREAESTLGTGVEEAGTSSVEVGSGGGAAVELLGAGDGVLAGDGALAAAQIWSP